MYNILIKVIFFLILIGIDIFRLISIQKKESTVSVISVTRSLVYCASEILSFAFFLWLICFFSISFFVRGAFFMQTSSLPVFLHFYFLISYAAAIFNFGTYASAQLKKIKGWARICLASFALTIYFLLPYCHKLLFWSWHRAYPKIHHIEEPLIEQAN